MPTLAQQALDLAGLANLAYLITIVVALYLGYKVFYKKEVDFRKALTGINALIVLFSVLVLNTVTTAIEALFGAMLAPYVALLITFLNSALVGATLVALGLVFENVIRAEAKLPGI